MEEMCAADVCVLIYMLPLCNSYNMDARALAYLLHEGAKRPRAINELCLSVHVITGLLQF